MIGARKTRRARSASGAFARVAGVALGALFALGACGTGSSGGEPESESSLGLATTASVTDAASADVTDATDADADAAKCSPGYTACDNTFYDDGGKSLGCVSLTQMMCDGGEAWCTSQRPSETDFDGGHTEHDCCKCGAMVAPGVVQ